MGLGPLSDLLRRMTVAVGAGVWVPAWGCECVRGCLGAGVSGCNCVRGCQRVGVSVSVGARVGV